MRFRAASLVISVCALVGGLGAQKKFVLSVDNIMRGPGLVGYEPQSPRWSGDSRRIYFEWKRASDPVLKPMDTYVADRDGGEPRKLTEDEAKTAPPASGELSEDRTKTVFVRDGDLFLYDFTTDRARQLTKTSDVESNAGLTRDGKRVWFTRGNNLYALSLSDGMLEQFTDIRTAMQPAEQGGAAATERGGRGRGNVNQRSSAASEEQQKGTDSQEFLKKEERELLDVVRQRVAIREEAEARRKRENKRKPFTLQQRQTVSSLSLSPDEKLVIALINEAGQGAKTTVVPNFVTESAYTEDISSRGKVGDLQPRSRLALISVENGSVTWVDHGQKDREVSLDRRPEWSQDGSKAVLLARAADNKDRWILALDPATGKTRPLVTTHDDAWVGGPGVTTLGWMKNDRDVYYQSERDGYSHLYTVSFDGGEPRQLTSGNWEVQQARLSKDKSRLYLMTNEGDPAEVHLYSMPADGGERTRLTRLPGKHAGVWSRDEQRIADVYSYANKPPELYAMENRAGAEERKLTSSPADDFKEFPWIDPPITHLKARDGAQVPVRVYKPTGFTRGGPAVIFVHGAGYLQNVHRWWQSNYYREYLFHHILMERGYLVIDIDYRGSAGYGRDWRTAIYRHMGGKDLDDHVDAAKWLVSQYGVAARRIGLYGGSYGGFITLMAMFTQSDVFAAGAALRPVTDWAHYNNLYTGNILNLPQRDAESYRQSSPIYFADGLKGALLICHGMVDTNVHFQDTVRLVQKLIELRKENWDLAAYPVEDHAFVQPTSWADEYKRILALFEKNLKKAQ